MENYLAPCASLISGGVTSDQLRSSISLPSPRYFSLEVSAERFQPGDLSLAWILRLLNLQAWPQETRELENFLVWGK